MKSTGLLKTQSALLEAMQEYAVTRCRETLCSGSAIFVLATQNPIEQEGTYPLPEAQLDRLCSTMLLTYPEFDQEVQVVKNTTSDYRPKLEK